MTEAQTRVYNSMVSVLHGNSSVEDQFCELVLNRLSALGYELQESDTWSLCFAIQKTENHYKNFCHFATVPKELYQTMCDAVCGEFLQDKFYLGTLQGFDVDQALKAVTMGDTSVTFTDDLSGQKKIDALLQTLIHGKEGDLICFRKLKW